MPDINRKLQNLGKLRGIGRGQESDIGPLARLKRLGLVLDAGWNEADHPREKDGKFTSGGGSSGGGSSTPAAAPAAAPKGAVRSGGGSMPKASGATKTKQLMEKAAAEAKEKNTYESYSRNHEAVQDVGKGIPAQSAKYVGQTFNGFTPPSRQDAEMVQAKYAEISGPKEQKSEPKIKWAELSPEQYSAEMKKTAPPEMPEDVKAKYFSMVEKEPEITADLQKTFQEIGQENEFSGLAFRCKQGDSLLRKVNSEVAEAQEAGKSDMTPGKAMDGIWDAVRYTQVSTPDKIADNFNDTIDSLEGKGYRVVRVSNSWDNPNMAYKGVNCRMLSPKGQKFELQFHTPDSVGIKESIHQEYEVQRVVPASDPLWGATERIMRAKVSNLEVPANVDRLNRKPTK